MTAPVISLDRVSRLYRLGDVEVRALDDVSLTVEPGEFVAIMGTSGSGKSTLMNILGCLDQPDSGHYLLEGVDTATLSEPDLARIRGQRIGFVFQSFNLLTRTAAIENVALPLFYAGQTEGSLERARAALERLGLSERQKNHPNQLSGGQQQRVAIARALINDPAILLADEPTGNVDSQTSADIMNAITTLNREQGVTVVLVTHEPDMAAYADRVIHLKYGRVQSDTRTRESVVRPRPLVAIHRPGRMEEIRSFLSLALLAALRAIGRHKMRAALTMLGVFIGVAALIAMVAVGEGARAVVKERLASLGTNLLIATPASTRSGGVRGGLGSASSLTVTDAQAILEEDSAVADVAYVNRQNAQIIYGDENWSSSVQGVTPSYLSIRNWAVASGRDFTPEDEHDGAMVCILGQSVVDNLFGEDSDPVGATVLVKSVPLTVVGVLAVKGNSGGGQDQDDVTLTPFSTSQQRILGVSTPSASVAAAAQSGLVISLGGPQSSPSNPFGIQPRLAGFVNAIYIQARDGGVTDQAV